MKIARRIVRILGLLLITTTTVLSLQMPAYAGMLGTGTVINRDQAASERGQLLVAWARQDVQQQLVALGVASQAARVRATSLSDEELHTLAGKLDQLPGGGDILGILVLLFVLLLMTDILGFIDIFPFVKKTAH